MLHTYPTEVFGVVRSDKPTAYGSIPLTPLSDNEVLIQIDSAVVNPSDMAYAMGIYPSIRNLPTTVGYEGAGTVVFVSENNADYLNKKVAFASDGKDSLGSWGTYCKVSIYSCVVLPDEIDLEKAAGMFVNPWTIYSFLEICKKKDYKTIVHSGASSSLGKMLVKECKKEGIKLINLVRRKEAADVLLALGAEIV